MNMKFSVNLFNKIAKIHNINIKSKCYGALTVIKAFLWCADQMTPTSPRDQYRVKFWPLGRLFRPNRPQTGPLRVVIFQSKS